MATRAGVGAVVTADAPQVAPAGPERSRRGGVARRTAARALVLGTGVAFALVARAYAAQSYYIPSPSMTPTLAVGDRIFVNKISRTINRGDMVVFTRVPADPETTYADLVKRVIGLPGETISSRGATVLIDGRPLREPWLPRLVGRCAEAAAAVATTLIPEGHYFVMGDCRGDSFDSRAWGTVPAANIIGKVEAIVWRNGHPWFRWF